MDEILYLIIRFVTAFDFCQQTYCYRVVKSLRLYFMSLIQLLVHLLIQFILVISIFPSFHCRIMKQMIFASVLANFRSWPVKTPYLSRRKSYIHFVHFYVTFWVIKLIKVNDLIGFLLVIDFELLNDISLIG